MTDYTGRLRLSIQDLNENPDSWGSVLNTGVFQLLDDALAGVVEKPLTDGGSNILTRNDGSNDEARYMIIKCTQAIATATNLTVPEGTDGGGPTGEAPSVDTSKLYLVWNATTGIGTLTVTTASGAGVEVPQGRATWVFCDGTNVIACNAITADAADTATTATNATQLGSVAAASYARLDQGQTFVGAQVPSRTTLGTTGTVNITATANNRFLLAPTGAVTLTISGGADGQAISIIVKQPAMANHTVDFSDAQQDWLFQGGTKPTFTAVNDATDMISAEYSSDANSGTGGWITAVLKDVKVSP